MALQRRTFLGAALGAMAGAPAAAQEIASTLAKPMQGTAPLPMTPGLRGLNEAMRAGVSLNEGPKQRAKRILRNLATRGEVESVLYEDYRTCNVIDHDLLNKRSYSYAAKVTFQRQRFVERRMRELQEETGYERIWQVINSAAGIKS